MTVVVTENLWNLLELFLLIIDFKCYANGYKSLQRILPSIA